MDKARPSRKRKTQNENGKFQDSWTEKYFFVQSFNNTVCLICKKTAAIPNMDNLKRHYDNLHSELYSELSEEMRKEKVVSLKEDLARCQKTAKDTVHDQETAMKVCEAIFKIIERKRRPFSDVDTIRESIMIAFTDVLPEDAERFKCVFDQLTVENMKHFASLRKGI